ncbi:MAG: TolC family protein, partial [Pseudomonadota bacterium]
MNHKLFILVALLFLQGCLATVPEIEEPQQPTTWTQNSESQLQLVDLSYLESWWKKFDDPVLNELVAVALENSPDRLIASARINQARGILRTTRSSLFPQVDVNASASREDTVVNGLFADEPVNFYDARFDASYELDIFGENRSRTSATEYSVQASEYEYDDVSLTLIGDVSRTYLRLREFQKQVSIAEKNLKLQQETLELVENQFAAGEIAALDVERADNLVNTTKASIPEFERQALNAQLQLVTLLGILPEELEYYINYDANIPGGDVRAVLLSPTTVLLQRPDVRAAFYRLNERASISAAESASIFPTFDIGGFYGIVDGTGIDSTTIWGIFINGAFSLIDFGRIEGRIDTAKADQVEAFEVYRRTILNALTEVEIAMIDYAKINNQRVSLYNAYRNAENASELSVQLFKEGEISFLDVLDAQRTVNESDSELVTA